MIDLDALRTWWSRIVPLGEYPALPDVPGVERSSPDRSAGHPNANIIDRHFAVLRHDLTRKPHSAYVCGCGQLFDRRLDWGQHVADLLHDH